MNYFGVKSSQANSQLQTTFRPRQPSQSTLPAAISNIQPGSQPQTPAAMKKPRCVATAGFQV
jgi:hypothetical protein